MKIVDLNLLKEIIFKLEQNQSANSTITEKEKVIAAEKLIKDYDDGKSKISDYRKEEKDRIVEIHRIKNLNNFSRFIDDLDKELKEIDKYEDDYIYLMQMNYCTTEAETRMRMKITKLGQEMQTIWTEVHNAGQNKNPFRDDTNKHIVLTRINEISSEIDHSVEEVHVLKILNDYYSCLSKRIWMGEEKIIYKE